MPIYEHVTYEPQIIGIVDFVHAIWIQILVCIENIVYIRCFHKVKQMKPWSYIVPSHEFMRINTKSFDFSYSSY